MAKTFEELKLEGGKELARLQAERRLNLGSHKRTRLKRAGCGESGTLLHDEVAERHANMLRDDYMKRFEKLTRSEAEGRLRFLTVLHSVVALSKDAVMPAVQGMETALSRVFDGSEAWALGAVEVEIVNVELLRRIGAGSDDEARKLNVLQRLHETDAVYAGDEHSSSRALVHFHGIVDLVNGNSTLREELLRERAKQVAAWQRSPYQVELKRLFKDRTVLQNVQEISNYLTKGGNEQLRYNAGFGRDLAEDLDAKIWRAGTGRADRGGETVADERGLTVGEIVFLDDIGARSWIAMQTEGDIWFGLDDRCPDPLPTPSPAAHPVASTDPPVERTDGRPAGFSIPSEELGLYNLRHKLSDRALPHGDNAL